MRAVRIGLVVAACALVWFGSRGRAITDSRADIALAWLVAVAGVVAPAVPADAGRRRPGSACPSSTSPPDGGSRSRS